MKKLLSILVALLILNTVCMSGSSFITGKFLPPVYAQDDDLWGNSIPQPKFAFDINYNSNQIKLMGANNDSLKIHYD